MITLASVLGKEKFMSVNTRIWITGAQGRMGAALAHHFDRTTEYEILTSDKDVPIDNLNEVIYFVDLNHPDIIINCAALSDVELCEKYPDQAFKVNAIGARNLAIAARRVDAKLIQISTDDVFGENSKEPHNEFDRPQPVTVYGKSKLAGEDFIKNLHNKHIIVRSTWIYGYNYDYLDGLLMKAKKGETVKASIKHYSTPTTCHALVDFLEKLLDASEYGTFHASCEGACRIGEFIAEAFRLAGLNTKIEMSEKDSLIPPVVVLDNMMMRITGIYKMPDWHDDLQAYINRRKERGIL